MQGSLCTSIFVCSSHTSAGVLCKSAEAVDRQCRASFVGVCVMSSRACALLLIVTFTQEHCQCTLAEEILVPVRIQILPISIAQPHGPQGCQ